MKERMTLERLTGIVAFARAASSGSFTAAARSLSVSPSAVSRTIGRLERQLGVRLFSRTTRSLTLTAEGQALHDRALQLLQAAEEVVQSAAAARLEPAGVLKVAASMPIGVRLLAPALPEFHRRHPKVRVDLRLGDRFVNLVEEGIDVAVRIGHLADSGLVSRGLARTRIGAFASPAYLARRGVPAHPEDLRDHDCVSFRYQASGQVMAWSFRVGRRIVEFRPDASMVVDASDAIAEVLAAGGGIGLLGSFIAEPYVERGLLRPVLGRFAIDGAPITAVWPESRRASPNARAFIAYLSEVFAPLASDGVGEPAGAAPAGMSAGAQPAPAPSAASRSRRNSAKA